MSDVTRSLSELVDLALQTPEKGAVNFNILRVVLLKIIEKLNFGEEKVEYKPPDLRSSILKSPEIKIPGGPYIKVFRDKVKQMIAEKKPEEKEEREVPSSKAKKVAKTAAYSEKLRTSEPVDSNVETEGQVTAPEEDMQPDSTTPEEPEVLVEPEDKHEDLQEDVVSSTTSETFSPESEDESEYEYEASEEEMGEEQHDDESITVEKGKSKTWPKQKRKYSEKRKFSREKQTEDLQKPKSYPQDEGKQEDLSTDEEPKQPMSAMYQIWQIKKLSVKVDKVEDRINSVMQSVEELLKFNEERERRTKFEEGQKLQSEYSSPYICREEFENTIDDMGEALSRLFTNQRHQREECNTINQNILEELSLKASAEDLNRHGEPINSKFRTLGMALTNIQKLIKDVIYPETCGVTKCIACGRKSQLPLRCIVLDGKKDTSEHKSAIDSIPKTCETEKSEELKFTNARLRRIEKHQKKKYQEVPLCTKQQDNHLESRPLVPDYMVELETLCDADKLSKEFAPLRRFPDLKRRNTLYIPSVRPMKNPVSISIIGNDNSQIIIKN